jgi:hypothetical protein
MLSDDSAQTDHTSEVASSSYAYLIMSKKIYTWRQVNKIMCINIPLVLKAHLILQDLF